MQTVGLVINNIEYEIDRDIWEKHIRMHPIRPMDALTHNLRVAGGKAPYTSEKIEKVILDEYNVCVNMSSILNKAEKIYEEQYSEPDCTN